MFTLDVQSFENRQWN
uniref:Uncharacterized protein n=1 Tax=Anguilla anguilla TaxID=7936 RepID=A0A0E9Q6F6_ANGAN